MVKIINSKKYYYDNKLVDGDFLHGLGVTDRELDDAYKGTIEIGRASCRERV